MDSLCVYTQWHAVIDSVTLGAVFRIWNQVRIWKYFSLVLLIFFSFPSNLKTSKLCVQGKVDIGDRVSLFQSELSKILAKVSHVSPFVLLFCGWSWTGAAGSRKSLRSHFVGDDPYLRRVNNVQCKSWSCAMLWLDTSL